MGSYLLSKFNRDDTKLSSDEWANIESIGREINGERLTLEEYLAVEHWYLSFFEELILLFKIVDFVLPWYEDNRYYIYSISAEKTIFEKIANPWAAYVAGDIYPIEHFQDLIRLGLRRLMSFEVDLGAIFVVSFDDMYFYIETSDNFDIYALARKHNLALVEFDKYEPQEPVFLDNL